MSGYCGGDDGFVDGCSAVVSGGDATEVAGADGGGEVPGELPFGDAAAGREGVVTGAAVAAVAVHILRQDEEHAAARDR